MSGDCHVRGSDCHEWGSAICTSHGGYMYMYNPASLILSEQLGTGPKHSNRQGVKYPITAHSLLIHEQ